MHWSLKIAALVFWVSVSNFKARAATPNDPKIVSQIAGCYEVRLARWWPWGLGGNAQFATPPKRIKLLTEQGAEDWQRDFLLIHPLPHTSGLQETAYWRIQGENRILLMWTDGFTGVSLNLQREKDVFHGWAHPHFDSFPPFVPHVAHARMHKIGCEGN